ncbi:MAG: hypothetical protein DMF85_16730 [Acidobacteria bacterium]|nr:MAG: hypothetical protein DMF85_16730 [Acidobacteriota bacterium]
MRTSAVGLCLILILHAGAPQARQQAAPAPAGSVPVTLTLRIAGDRTRFRPGEMIPIQLEFTSPIAKRFVVDNAIYDRSGRLTIDEFSLEPNERVSDPLLDYFGSGAGFIGGGLRGMPVLGDKPATIDLELNDWFRLDEPGAYRLSTRSRRVIDDTQPSRTEITVESNEVTFEILPRDPAWEAQQLAAAVGVLDGKSGNQRQACRTLRFLGTDAAVDEMVKRYDDNASGCGFEYMTGLFSASHRDYVVRRMEAGLGASDQPVTRNYLRTLAVLSAYKDHPELRPAQTRQTKGRMPPSRDLEPLSELTAAAEAKYAAIVAAALPGKTAQARAIILAERLDSSARHDTAPAGSDDDRKQIAASFSALSADRQITLLQYEWRRIEGPAMLPLLRAIVSNASTADQIRNPLAGVSLKTLGALPDRELPELDDVLAANLDGDRRPFEIRAELLQRYASPAVAPRVLARYGNDIGRLACRPQAALLAYFTRADEKTGATLLDRALASRAQTGCFRRAIRDVATYHMGAAVEAAAVAHLDDPDPEVVASAAETLGRFGSAKAVSPLRARLERFHDEWRDRGAELRFSYVRLEARSQAGQAMVELSLLQALAKGRAWLSERAALADLRALCVTDNCRQHADQMLAASQNAAITIVRLEGPDDSFITIAQYDLSSVAALEEKLAQYPAGAVFTLELSNLDPQTASTVASRIKRIADAYGIVLR